MRVFLNLHQSYDPDGGVSLGTSAWTDADFEDLLDSLGYAVYGWLRLEGVRKQLEKMVKGL
jgi:hypothetical protein